MMRLFRDPYKLSLLIATIFFVGIVASFYFLYTMPHHLMLTDGFQSVFTTAYIIIGFSFLAGVTAIYVALRYRKEVIVFRDRQKEAQTEKSAASDAAKTTITLESVVLALNQSQSEKEILEAGLQAVCRQVDAGQGAIYLAQEKDGHRKVELKNGYALSVNESTAVSFEFGEGLIGQAAASARMLYIDDVPEGYIKIISGLGSASPRYLFIVPMKQQENVVGVLEIASFQAITEDKRKFVDESAQLIADKISTK